MTLPFFVPPQVWPLAIVGMLIARWVYTRPSYHWIKQLFWIMVESEVNSYRWLLGAHARYNMKRAVYAGRYMFLVLMLSLMASGMLSLLVCVGLLRNPPIPIEPPAHFDASKYEIITDGQMIYARPRTRPTTRGE